MADPYVSRHVAVHAAGARRLGELVKDAGFVVNAEPGRLLEVLGAVDPAEHPPVRVYWRTAHHLRDWGAGDRANILRTTALEDEPHAAARIAVPEGPPLTVRYARLTSSHVHRTLYGHTGTVYAVVFLTLGDGTAQPAGGGYDGTIRLWDPLTGRAIYTLPVSVTVHALAFSGDRLVAGTARGLLVVDCSYGGR
ncbi:hypothetical protein GCM10009677_26180 [Sphaerisporangium rubeum]|uniref:WD40 repeat domain-containing protein n=1 Tax=Sphaerisporangium rubeum TaxID=321317 RepID=A0A7X0I9X2_9ACTN|nr:hypothetical protein [Sphaerisporangium rubeum]MBB6471329.1 hypothetical protein [Sphaerisporangium rubeum]